MTALADRIREHLEMAGAMPAPPLDLDAPVRRARRRRRNRIVALAVSAILAVAGVAGVISSLAENDEGATRTVGRPDAPVEVESALPAVVMSMVGGSPIVSDTEVLETVVVPSTIGDLVWTVISVDPALLSTEGIVATPAGFASIGTDGQLLLSDDALEWAVFASPFPDEIVELREIRAEEYPAGPSDAEFLVRTTGPDGSSTLWFSRDFVTWHRQAGAAPTPRWVEEFIAGPEFLLVEAGRFAGYEANVELPDGSHLTNVNANIDWEGLALRSGGEEFLQRLTDGALLAGNTWDPATGIVDILLFADAEEQDLAQPPRPNGPAPQPSGVQFRLSASGTLDAWVVDVENVATGEVIGSITGSLPPLAPEGPPIELSQATLDDTLQLLAKGGLGAFFLSSEDGLELVGHPP